MYKPLILAVIYLLTCCMVSFYGPIEYVGYEKVGVIVYLTAIILFFSIGFRVAVWRYAEVGRKFAVGKDVAPPSRIFFLVIILGFIKYLIDFLILFVFGDASFSLESGAQQYVDFYSEYRRSHGNYSFQFLIESILTPVCFAALVFGLHYWKWHGRFSKVVTVALFLLVFSIYAFGYGKQKQVADLAVIAFSVYLLGARYKKSDFDLKKLIFISCVIIALALSITLSLMARYASVEISFDNYNEKTLSLYYINYEKFPFSLIPPELVFSIGILCFYMGGGFFGLSLALQQEMTWSWFLGSSYTLSVLAKLSGLPFFYELTYPYKVGVLTGWDESKWHSIFSWIASDFTFSGALLVYLVAGYFYGRSWLLAKYGGGAIHCLFFVWLSIGIVYAPANNQLMHSPGGFFTTMILLFFSFIRVRRLSSVAS